MQHPTPGAIRAATIIMGDDEFIFTSFGRKSLTGLASLIDIETTRPPPSPGDTPVPVKLERWGCYVWLDNGDLAECEINDYESTGDEYAADVTAPDSQAFLDDVNRVLGSAFLFDDFAGR